MATWELGRTPNSSILAANKSNALVDVDDATGQIRSYNEVPAQLLAEAPSALVAIIANMSPEELLTPITLRAKVTSAIATKRITVNGTVVLLESSDISQLDSFQHNFADAKIHDNWMATVAKVYDAYMDPTKGNHGKETFGDNAPTIAIGAFHAVSPLSRLGKYFAEPFVTSASEATEREKTAKTGVTLTANELHKWGAMLKGISQPRAAATQAAGEWTSVWIRDDATDAGIDPDADDTVGTAAIGIFDGAGTAAADKGNHFSTESALGRAQIDLIVSSITAEQPTGTFGDPGVNYLDQVYSDQYFADGTTGTNAIYRRGARCTAAFEATLWHIYQASMHAKSGDPQHIRIWKIVAASVGGAVGLGLAIWGVVHFVKKRNGGSISFRRNRGVSRF